MSHLILGYGEDSLTLWVLQSHLDQFLEQLGDATDPSEALVIYRPVLRGFRPVLQGSRGAVTPSRDTPCNQRRDAHSVRGARQGAPRLPTQQSLDLVVTWDCAEAEAFGDDFRVDTVGERQGCPSMAEIIEADPGQPGCFGEFGESSADPWWRYRVTAACEHKIVVGVAEVFAELGFECGCAVVAQRGGGGGVELHDPS